MGDAVVSREPAQRLAGGPAADKLAIRQQPAQPRPLRRGGERGGGVVGERAHEDRRGSARSMLAVDFFTVETVALQRLYGLFFIELGSRRAPFLAARANPTGAWVTQQARQFAWTLSERSTPLRFLIRDRDSKFTRDFDTVFRNEGIEIIQTPIHAPKANAISPSASCGSSAPSASTGS